jgi:hypothetical protein
MTTIGGFVTIDPDDPVLDASVADLAFTTPASPGRPGRASRLGPGPRGARPSPLTVPPVPHTNHYKEATAMPIYSDNPPEPFTLDRPGQVPLSFDGWRIGHFDSRTTMTEHQLKYRDRWADVSIYRTTTGKWVVAQIGKTREPGRRERGVITVCETPSDVLEALKKREGYVSKTNMTALQDAMENDPELVIVEHI